MTEEQQRAAAAIDRLADEVVGVFGDAVRDEMFWLRVESYLSQWQAYRREYSKATDQLAAILGGMGLVELVKRAALGKVG